MKLLIKKALKDFTMQGKQAVLSVISIILGMTFFGLMMFSDTIINREIGRVYKGAEPASFTLNVSGADDTSEIEQILGEMESVESYEVKPASTMEIRTKEGDWKSLYLFGVDLKEENKLNQLSIQEGNGEIKQGEAYIEIGAEGVAGYGPGDTVVMRSADGKEQEIKLSGSLNDMFVHPAYVHDCVYLYVPKESMKNYGEAMYQVNVKCSKTPYDKVLINRVSQEICGTLKENQMVVTEVSIADNPGESMHAGEYKSTLFLLRIFSCAALIFGCITVATLLASIFASIIRQIGILKAFGTSTRQIYLAYGIAFGMILVGSAIVSAILSIATSGALCRLLLSLGDIVSDQLGIGFSYIAAYIAIIIILPMIIMILPLRKGIGVSVKDAINDYGIQAGGSVLSSGKGLLKKLSRPARISIRNVFLKKKQLFVNSFFLVLGGLLFVLVLTTSNSIKASLNSYMDCFDYDYEFSAMSDTLPVWEEKSSQIKDIKEYEIWKTSQCMKKGGNEDASSVYQIVCAPSDTRMYQPIMKSGSWVEKEDTDSVVISEKAAEDAGKNIGDTIELVINGKTVGFKIKGIVKVFEVKEVYFNTKQMEAYVPENFWTYNIKCSLKSKSWNSRTQIHNLEDAMEENGIRTMNGQSKAERGDTLINHYMITLNSLLVVVVVLVIVIGFGISASLRIQMQERSREIGILKSIGATYKKILHMFTAESAVFSMLVILAVWLFGVPVILFGCELLGKFVLGEVFLISPMTVLISYAIWFALCSVVVLFSYRRSVKKAAKVTIREVFG